MKCAQCGKFYNSKCEYWPECYPSEVDAWVDWGFQVATCLMLGAILVVLISIWVKL